MPNQKFNTTVFVPRLTEIVSIIEIDVGSQDKDSDIEKKLIKKINLNKCTSGILLSTNSPQLIFNLAKLIQFEQVHK